MKKIKKIRIVEEGHFSPEELKEVRGGTGCNTYNSCGLLSYEKCRPGAASYGFQSTSGTISCDTGYYYATCGVGTKYISCGSGSSYSC